MDYLGSQKLLGYALGQRTRPVAANVAQPTQLELTAQADWDETDLQVKSLIALRLSSNLRTHIGTTSEETWMSLDTTFGTLRLGFGLGFGLELAVSCILLIKCMIMRRSDAQGRRRPKRSPSTSL